MCQGLGVILKQFRLMVIKLLYLRLQSVELGDDEVAGSGRVTESLIRVIGMFCGESVNIVELSLCCYSGGNDLIRRWSSQFKG
jgi:hypothetical protein